MKAKPKKRSVPTVASASGAASASKLASASKVASASDEAVASEEGAEEEDEADFGNAPASEDAMEEEEGPTLVSSSDEEGDSEERRVRKKAKVSAQWQRVMQVLIAFSTFGCACGRKLIKIIGAPGKLLYLQYSNRKHYENLRTQRAAKG